MGRLLNLNRIPKANRVNTETNAKTVKICLAASSGGHLSQLIRLSGSWKGREVFCVTTTDVVERTIREFGKVYVVGECNRNHPIRVVKVLFRCLRIVLRERPDVVISTGAAAGCMICFLGKILGAKVVWVDSIANVENLSLSGRIIRPFASLILTQWPNVAAKYKSVQYVGTLI